MTANLCSSPRKQALIKWALDNDYDFKSLEELQTFLAFYEFLSPENERELDGLVGTKFGFAFESVQKDFETLTENLISKSSQLFLQGETRI